MKRSLLGVGVGDLRLPVKQALRRAAQMGFGVVELPAAGGETTSDTLSGTGRRDLARLVRSLGLRIAALDGDLGSRALADPKNVEQHIDRTKSILELAADMDVPIVAASIAAGDDEADDPPSIDVLREIAAHADRTGTIFAVRTGWRSAQQLADLIKRVDCDSMCVCVDPASLLMNGEAPIEAIGHLAEQVCLSYARDAIAASTDGAAREMPLGQGQVDLPAYLAALDAAGYHGPHIVRRLESQRPIDDIMQAKSLLDSQP